MGGLLDVGRTLSLHANAVVHNRDTARSTHPLTGPQMPYNSRSACTAIRLQ